MFVKVKNWLREFRLSLRLKIVLSLSAIAVVLLMSGIISFLEYRHMSNYVSELIAGNVNNIHRTQELVGAVDAYNLDILAVIGDDKLSYSLATDVVEKLRATGTPILGAIRNNSKTGGKKYYRDKKYYRYSSKYYGK